MDYPILIGGERAGTLRESQSGLYTLFEAGLPEDPGGLVRLYVHGGGRSAYLGLLTPDGGGLALRRRLSALERRALPAEIAFASDAAEASDVPEVADATTPPDAAEVADATTPPDASGDDAGKALPSPAQAETGLHNIPSPPQTTLSACPWPAPTPEGDGDLLWLRCTDGTLRAFDGVSGLVAFPAALKRPVRGAELRRIGDADYLVFRR